MAKTFIVGGAASVWMREYIKNVHVKLNNDVSLATFEKTSDEFKEAYDAANVKVVALGNNKGLIGKIEKTFKLLLFSFINRNRKFNYLEIHCPPHNFQAFIFYLVAVLLRCRVILVFWGSDILRLNKKKANKLKPILKIADTINLATHEMRNTFVSYYGEEYNKKITMANFGSLAYEEIRKLKECSSKSECKESLGIIPDKLCVAVGYNGNPMQQHLKVLRELYNLDEDVKRQIVLFLHLVDCPNEKYRKEVLCMLESSNIDYIVEERLLSLQEISKLRLATDVFIHAQTTDALSGTIRECFFSETILVNPSWINYSEYDEFGIEYIKYSKFEEVPKILKKILNNRISIDKTKNARIAYNQYSWNAVRKDWAKIFNERTN